VLNLSVKFERVAYLKVTIFQLVFKKIVMIICKECVCVYTCLPMCMHVCMKIKTLITILLNLYFIIIIVVVFLCIW